MTTLLSPSQQLILSHAANNTEGKLVWFPDSIKGGARKKVLDSLCKRGLIAPLGSDWFVAAEAYDALGRPRPAPITVAKLDTIVANAEATQPAQTPKPRTRDNSKQATIISMLKRPEGATIAQICETTGWQPHTVRGTFAGAFKKKLGLEITSSKTEGSDRTYRITTN
jgi:hypothetical protein